MTILEFAPGMAGNNIYNGAVDKCDGLRGLLKLAREWSSMGIAAQHDLRVSDG